MSDAIYFVSSILYTRLDDHSDVLTFIYVNLINGQCVHLHNFFLYSFFRETTLFPLSAIYLLLGVMYWTIPNNSFVSLCNWRNVSAKKIFRLLR